MIRGFIHEITGRCNLACAFCYNVWNAASDGTPPEELAPEEAFSLLERTLVDSQAGWLTFTGGEPLLYPGLERVMARVHRRFPEVRLGLATNGVLLDGARLEALVAVGLQFVEISLFASDAVHYARLAGCDRRNLALEALARTRARRLPVTAATVLYAGIEDQLEDIIRIACALGADRLALNRFVARGRGMGNQAALAPSQEALGRMLALADRLGGELHFPIVVTTPIEACLLPHAQFPHLDFGPCICGEAKWAIDPRGNLRLCELDDRILGDLKQGSFRDLAQDPRVAAFRRSVRGAACAQCPSMARCGGGCRFP